jgi:hypothetical protein
MQSCLHIPAAHVLLVELQKPLWQSLLTLQLTPIVQARHAGPPQSTPVSLPFLMPSEQVAAAHSIGN